VKGVGEQGTQSEPGREPRLFAPVPGF